MRSSIAAVAVAVGAAVVLAGVWLFAKPSDDSGAVAQAGAAPAPTTRLDLGDGSRPPKTPTPPLVPTGQVMAKHTGISDLLSGEGGRVLFVPAIDSKCTRDEIRLLREQSDLVEIEVRSVSKPKPPDITVAPDGSYGCAEIVSTNGNYAVVRLRDPLGTRMVQVTREPR